MDHLQTITKGTPIRDSLDNARVLFKVRQSVDLFHVLKTVKGLLHLGPSRTPQETVTVFGCIEGSFLVNRSGDSRNTMYLIYIGWFMST